MVSFEKWMATVFLSSGEGSEALMVLPAASTLLTSPPKPCLCHSLRPRDCFSAITIKKADIAEKQSRQRKEWQRHGFGGLVSNVDAAGNTINASLTSPEPRKDSEAA